MNVLDLFSGIGGFSLGLERAGMRTVAFCEVEPFCQAVLRKHWPKVQIYDDVRTLSGDRLHADGHAVDVICGGFPCQDISYAGRGAGLEGERSGLWTEYARLIGELRPRYVIVENVAALLGRGLERVLGDLAKIGFDAEWHCIPASAVGAPHRRDRFWLVACPEVIRRDERRNTPYAKPRSASDLTDARGLGSGGADMANANQPRLEGWIRQSLQERSNKRAARQGDTPWVGRAWLPEPNVGRVADGVPARVDRLKSLGNAVVPQIPEIIGRAIMRAEQVND